MNLSLPTMIELSALYTDTFLKAVNDQVPFEEQNHENSLLYALVYGESPAQMDELHSAIGGRKKFMCAEMFAGNGIESYLLAKDYPNATFHYLDIERSVNQLPKLTNFQYGKADHFKLSTSVPNQYDLVFVGGANASLCCVPDVTRMENVFLNAYAMLKNGGKFLGAAFTDEGDSDEYSINYDLKLCEYHKKYKGYRIESLNLYPYWRKNSGHQYFHLLAIHGKKGVEKVLYNTDGFYYRSWSSSYLIHIAETVGFNFEKFDGRYLVFTK